MPCRNPLAHSGMLSVLLREKGNAMNKISWSFLMLVVAGTLSSSVTFADKHEKHHKEKRHRKESRNPHCGEVFYDEGHRGCRVVEVREEYRPRKGRCYHPKWHPRRDFERRWVYFPRYNMYWDNYRGVYVYNSYGRWVAEPEPPRIAVNVNLAAERFVELGIDLDARSDAFTLNSSHRIVFKL